MRAVRNDTKAAIAIVDLDRFKEVNDTLGHHSGDELLTQLAQRLADHMRPQDAVARLGGDEFGVVLSGVTDTEEVLTRLRGRDRARGGGERAALVGGVEHRVRGGPRRRHRRRRPPPARRRGHVPGQGPAHRGHALRRRPRPLRRGQPGADRRSAPRHRQRRARAPLPAQGRPHRRPRRRGGSAGSLAPPHLGTPLPRPVHPPVRADRPHRQAHRMGDAHRPGRRARPGARGRGRQRVGPQPGPRPLRRRRSWPPWRVGCEPGRLIVEITETALLTDPPRRRPCWPSWTRRACGSAWTTSASARRRSATCPRCPCTSSRSTRASSWT